MGDQSARAKRTRGTTRGAKPISVLIVDDHPIWRETMRKILELRRFAQVAAEADDGGSAVTSAQEVDPDVVIMDIDMPGTDGLEATRRILDACPSVKVLMLSASSEPEKIGRAVRAGATGYLVKTAKPTEVVDAVRRVFEGELVFPPDVAEAVMGEIRRPSPAPVEETISVSVVDPSAIDREGLASLLRSSGFQAVSVASSIAELSASLRAAPPPNVALIGLDPTSPEGTAIDEVLAIRRDNPTVGMLVLSHRVDGAEAARLLGGETKGAGWLLRSTVSHLDELGDAVRRVARGEAVIDPQVIAHLVDARERRSPIQDLSEREGEVLALMAQGRSNQAISEQLHMAPKTVEGHVANIFMKLGFEPAADDHRRVLAVLAYLRSL